MPYEPNLHLMCHAAEVQTVVGMRRTWNRPDRVQPGPVLAPTEPWEGTAVVAYGTAYHDADSGGFHFWYETANSAWPPPSRVLCYATSTDGVHWEKPKLGLFEWQGSSANNIVWIFQNTGIWDDFDGFNVLVEPDAPAHARFKMVIYTRATSDDSRAFFVLTSPDGLRWTWRDEPFLTDAGDRFHCVRDERHGDYLLTTRRARLEWDKHGDPPRPWKRTITRWRSPDLQRWEGGEQLLKADDADLPEAECYSMYPIAAGNGYVGYLELYDRLLERLHTELVVSWDGDHWERVDRTPWLDRGTDGAWDDMWVFPSSNDPLVVGDRMLVHYSGRGSAHAGDRPPMRPYRSSIGLAWLGRDRWAALSVGQDGGEFITEPVTVSGDCLWLNADAEFGDVRVQILDATDGPHDGFGFDAADRIDRDGVDLPVSWGGSRSLADLRGRSVRLHVKAARASIYGYRFADA